MQKTLNSETPKVILLHETAWESWASDLGTFAMIVGLWSLGWFAGSPALEWVGVVMGLFFTVVRAIGEMKGEKRHMTPSEARAWLDQNFPEDT